MLFQLSLDTIEGDTETSVNTTEFNATYFTDRNVSMTSIYMLIFNFVLISLKIDEFMDLKTMHQKYKNLSDERLNYEPMRPLDKDELTYVHQTTLMQ